MSYRVKDEKQGITCQIIEESEERQETDDKPDVEMSREESIAYLKEMMVTPEGAAIVRKIAPEGLARLKCAH